MIPLLLTLLLIGAIFLTLLVCLITLQLWRMLLGEAPYIPVQHKILSELVTHIPLKAEMTFYELGCGDGRILIACHQKEPDARYIGIEKNLLPYLLAQWNLLRYGRPKNITILKKDIFQTSYADADIIYAYLFPGMLDTLFLQLIQELSGKAIIITPTFRFSKKQPSETIPLPFARTSGARIQEIHITRL